MKNNLIISIGRQFGAGGRAVGKKLSEKLGIDYYDKELILEAAKDFGFAPEFFENADEKSATFSGNVLQWVESLITGGFQSKNFLSQDTLFEMQSSAIKRLAEEKSCIIVGRCSDYVLRDNPNCVSVFLHSSNDDRAERICQRNNITKEEALTKYIQENYPVKANYIQFIKENMEDGRFPSDEIYKDKDLKEEGEGYYDSWYNARYLQTIKAFPVYKRLLDEYNSTNFAHIQSKALEILKKESITQYKHILVDEFQDTDPIQIQIFEILMNQALKNNTGFLEGKELKDELKSSEDDIDIKSKYEEYLNCFNNKKDLTIEGTFTAVGDMNQNIYGFRGAVKNYFEQFSQDYECEILPINYNYRSSNQIVELSESLIKNYRRAYSKQNVQSYRDINKDCYYIQSADAKIEAFNIALIIQNLVNSGKAEYKDILILFRSVIHHSKELVESFNYHEIPYHIRGSGSLDDNDEVKSIITLLDFLVQSEGEVPVHGSWDFLGINGFIGEKFDTLWSLSLNTQEKLRKVQEEYEAQVLNVGKRVQKEMGAPNRRTFKTMFNHDKDVLEEIFKEVKEPILTMEFLKSVGVTDIDEAFGGCVNLKSLGIPSSLKTIDKWSFWQCFSLKTINVTRGDKDRVMTMFAEAGYDISKYSFIEPLLDGGPYELEHNGILWQFDVRNQKIVLTKATPASSAAFIGKVEMPRTLGGLDVVEIGIYILAAFSAPVVIENSVAL